MIAEKIYKGATAEDLGIPEVQYASRRAVLDRFLAQWSGGDFRADYRAWIKTQQEGRTASRAVVVGSDIPAKAGLSDMARNAAGALGRALKSGGRRVPLAEQERRLAICRGCQHWTGRRCLLCGCFGKLKTRLATESCPIGKW